VEGFIDAYAVLGVAPGVGAEELKRAHRALVRRHHPDLVPPAQRPAATRRVQEINVAYGLVRDPSARARYDRVRTVQRARERAAAPVRQVDRAAAAQWAALLSSAGRWAGRWWWRHRRRFLHGARRVRRAGVDVMGRILWLVSCAVGSGMGLAAATAAMRLAAVEGVVVPLVGLAVGLTVGHRRGWRRRLRLAGLPPQAAHRLRGWAELIVAAAVIAAAAALRAALVAP
jgi:hypothetical protein